MNYEEITEQLTDFAGDVFFVSLLDDFVWNVSTKQVVGYNVQSDYNNILEVKKTIPVDLGTGNLLDYLKKNEIDEKDVIVFCVNKEFYPKKEGNWILFNVIKNVNKKKSEFKYRNQDNENEKN